MRKRLVLSVCVVIAAGIVWLLWSFQSKAISVELQGTKYRLGEKNQNFSESVKVKINGRLQYSITGERIFRGAIELEGDNSPVPADQRQLILQLTNDQPGLIIYNYFEDGKTKFHHVGGLFINSDCTKVAFYLFDPTTNEGSNGGYWTGDNGLMLSAPASNRAEALAVSQELMKSWTHAPDFR